MNEQQTQVATQQQVSGMPKLDYTKLNGLFGKAQGGRSVDMQQGAVGGQQETGAGNLQQQADWDPDVVSAQEEFKDVQDGDTYTDPNGTEWVWNVMDYVVVPEEVKDEEVDDLIVEGEGEDDSDGGEVVVHDEADKILWKAINEVLGATPTGVVVEDDNPYTPDESRISRLPENKPLVRRMTAKRQGYETNDPAEIAKIAPTQWKRGRVSVNGVTVYNPDEVQPGQTVRNASNMVPADKRAMENARMSHRRHVAATWNECKAKDKARCPYHGAAYMTDKLGEIIAANGIKGAKYGILMHDPEVEQGGNGKNDPVQYRILFALPKDVSADVRKKIAKEFFDKNPSIIFTSAGARRFGRTDNNTVFSVRNPEQSVDDLPIDAPTREELESRHDTAKEQEYQERAKARGAVSWTSFDTLDAYRYFDMLSERPTNIVECNDDMLRYAQQFSEYLPKGMRLEEVQNAYNAFMKANKKKKGLQAFLLNGETVDKAEALAAAAEKGLEKEGQAYYGAAEKSLDMANSIFRSVQDALVNEYRKLRSEVYGMPDGRDVIGEWETGKRSVYFGKKYDCKGRVFPLNVGGEDEEVLRQAALEYKNLWNTAAKNFDSIQQGCETREPMEVLYGIRKLETTIQALKNKGEIIGEIQDAIVEAQDPRWLKKHGISVPGEKGKTGIAEQSIEKSGEVEGKVVEKEGVKGKKAKDNKEVAGRQQAEVQQAEEAVVETGNEGNIEETEVAKEEVAAEPKAAVAAEAETSASAEEEVEGSSSRGETGENKQGVPEGQKEETAAVGEGRTEVSETSGTEPKRKGKSRFSEEDTKAIEALAMKNKSFVALNKKRTEMYQAFGKDSEQYKEATAKAKEALGPIIKDYINSKRQGAVSETPSGASSTAGEGNGLQKGSPKSQVVVEEGGKEAHSNETKTETGTTVAGGQETQTKETGGEKQSSVSADIGKSEAQVQREGQRQESGSQVEARNQQSQTKKQSKRPAPKSTVVQMARGDSQAGEESKVAQGKGVDIAKGIQIPDNPTLEDATKINKQLADLEKRIRGLARVYSSSYTEESDYRAAEKEIQGVKAEIDRVVNEAKGKGLYWTKDMPKYSESGSTARPLDLPTNFRISGIKGANGETVNVPYKAPAANEIDMPDSKAHEARSKARVEANKSKSVAPFKKKDDYTEDFWNINDKVGAIGSVYGDKTVEDLVFDGFSVSIPFRKKDGTMEWFLGKPYKGDAIGVSRDGKNPPIPLSVLFAKRFGGNPNDETALRHFVEAIKSAAGKQDFGD